MQIDYAGVIGDGFLVALDSFIRAFQANPWPWVLIPAFLIAGWALDRATRQKR